MEPLPSHYFVAHVNRMDGMFELPVSLMRIVRG